MRWRKSDRANRVTLLLVALLSCGRLVRADDLVTREYRLRNSDATNIIPVINFAIANPTGKRITSGSGKRLVVTDIIEQQDAIAQLLPIIDQASIQTDARKIRTEMLVRAAQFLQQQKKASQVARTPTASPAAASNDPSGKIDSYDVRHSTRPYKSVYSDEDAKLMKNPRKILDEPALPSLSALTLKGIFKASTGSRLALLSYEGKNYTARDGGLFDASRTRVKGVTSEVQKDRVLLTGPDRISREIKFKSTL